MLDFIQPTAPTMPPAITAAAASLATAVAQLDTAKAGLVGAEKNSASVRSRVTALEQERAAIGQRRASGQHEQGDGGRLELIRLDLEGLAPLQAEADAAVGEARQKVEAVERLVASARAQLDRAEAEAQLAALVEHAQKLDTLMVTTLGQIAEVAAQIGAPSRPPWAPTPNLVLAIRKHAAAHGLL